MPDPQMPVTVVRSTDGVKEVGIAGAGTPQATKVIALPWWQLTAVRVARTYIQVVLGVLTADGFGVIELASGQDLSEHVIKAAFVGLAPAIIAVLQEGLELLTKLDSRYPELMG